MPLRVVQKMLCDKNQERFMGRFTEEYPLGPQPGPSFLIRKIQADGSSRDFLFDGTPYVAPEAEAPGITAAEKREAPAAFTAENRKAPAATAAGSVAADVIGTEPAAVAAGAFGFGAAPAGCAFVPELVKAAPADSHEAGFASDLPGELTARETACLSDPLPEPDEHAECLCDACGGWFLPRTGEDLEDRIAEFLGDLDPIQNSASSQPAPSVERPAPVSVEEQRQAALKKADAAPRCIHIKSDGQRCAAPAINGDPFCFFHGEARAKRALAQMSDLQMPVLEDRRSLQLAIMRVNALTANKAIDAGTARLLFAGLRIAQRNLTSTGTLDFGKSKRGAA